MTTPKTPGQSVQFTPERHRFLIVEVHSIRNAMWNAMRQGRQVPQSTKDELTKLETELATYDK